MIHVLRELIVLLVIQSVKKLQDVRTAATYKSSSYFTSDPDTRCLCHTISPPSVIYIASSALCLGVRNVSDDTVSR